MDPEKACCPNPACPCYGQAGQGNVRLHSKKDNRLRCRNCRRTFSARSGTVFYRRRYDEATITCVITLLAYACPVQAICRAFDVDERTVASWHQGAGLHCEQVHAHLIEAAQMDLQHVQADELRIKAQGQILWMALALCVTTRLWLGGVVSTTGDKAMAYVEAFRKAFRSPVHTGRRGRPRLLAWPKVILGRVIKSRQGRRLERMARQVLPNSEILVLALARVPATEALAETLISASQGGGVLNTAYIERMGAAMRSVMSALARAAVGR